MQGRGARGTVTAGAEGGKAVSAGARTGGAGQQREAGRAPLEARLLRTLDTRVNKNERALRQSITQLSETHVASMYRDPKLQRYSRNLRIAKHKLQICSRKSRLTTRKQQRSSRKT